MVAVVLLDHTLRLLVEGCDGRVAPPLVQVAVLVVLAPCATEEKKRRHTHIQSRVLRISNLIIPAVF